MKIDPRIALFEAVDTALEQGDVESACSNLHAILALDETAGVYSSQGPMADSIYLDTKFNLGKLRFESAHYAECQQALQDLTTLFESFEKSGIIMNYTSNTIYVEALVHLAHSLAHLNQWNAAAAEFEKAKAHCLKLFGPDCEEIVTLNEGLLAVRNQKLP
jgi:hypothetical protein